MSLLDSSLVAKLENYLHLTSFRVSLVANNIANIDTPNYHTQDIDFQSEMRRAEVQAAGAANPAVRNVPGLMERPDGNNVDMDREALLLAQLQLQYTMGAQLLREQFKNLQAAINEG